MAIAIDADSDQLFATKARELDAAVDIGALAEAMQRIVNDLLRRNEDAGHRDKALRAAQQYFSMIEADSRSTPEKKMETLRRFAKEAVRIVINNRPVLAAQAAARQPPEPGLVRRNTDKAVFAEECSASDVEAPTTIELIPPPTAEQFPTFQELFPAALCWQVKLATTFFQRNNPEVNRGLKRPFMLSKQFDAKFAKVVREIIVPRMFEISRAVGMLEASRQWAEIDTKRFWEVIEEDPKIKDRVMAAWDAAWTGIKQVRQSKQKGKETVVVLVAPKILLDVRTMLEPGPGDDYDLPPIRNREIDLFISFLTAFDRKTLEYYWVKLRQLYEQEMDRRWYQDKARDGALRDSLLEAFANFSDQMAEFMALLCYFNFPFINIPFLERFTHNRGTNTEERNDKIPYLMRFLGQDGILVARQREIDAERERRLRDESRKQAARNADDVTGVPNQKW